MSVDLGWSCKALGQCYTKVYGLVVLLVDLLVSGVELDGPGMRTVLSEDWVVL